MADGGATIRNPTELRERSQFPQALGYNEPCESRRPEPLVIRDNAWPSVPKDIPGSPEAGPALPSALALCPCGAPAAGGAHLATPSFQLLAPGVPATPFLWPTGSSRAPTLLAWLLCFLPAPPPSLSGWFPGGQGLEARAPREVTEQCWGG